ncbi:MAG: hypothetical protein ABIP55_07340 [Tepidisphaeraceae bacterium]
MVVILGRFEYSVCTGFFWIAAASLFIGGVAVFALFLGAAGGVIAGSAMLALSGICLIYAIF